MGVKCSGGALPESSSKYLQLLKQSQVISNQLCQKHKLPHDSQFIIKRIVQSKQSHLLAALEMLSSKNQKILMLSRLEFVNLELLDSLYYNLIEQTLERQDIQTIQPYNNISIIKYNHQEKYKEIGVDSLRKAEGIYPKIQKVAVLLLAGGVSYSYGEPYKQIIPIQLLPSKKSLLQLQIDRCQSIAELMQIKLHIIVMISDSKYEVKKYILDQEHPNLQFHFTQQYQLGILTQNGKVVMQSPKSFAMFPNGTGDFLSSLNQQKLLTKLKEQQIQYLSVCSINNITQPIIDSITLGYLIRKNLDIVGKCIQAQNKNQLSKIISIKNKIYITDNRQMKTYQSLHPEIFDEKIYNNAQAFTNSSVFKIDFLLSILSDQHWNYSNGRSYRAKSILIHSFDPQLQIVNKVQAYIFEKDFSDLFWFTKNFEIIQIEGDVYFPIITQQDQYSFKNGVKQMSNLHKKWLKLNTQNKQQICQINAQISIWGENLEEIIQQLKVSEIEYPLYIYNI